ncbi:unnamed protein product [Clonostachys rhizophaga]|uniref:Uncharacterized protein n=1 Tax=Clonostachys rhizophaga TaxID=160324 RepID=A0A9N9YLG9_9HYPO|nr:unnamed protein product [Clonostachys rhizophaga]
MGRQSHPPVALLKLLRGFCFSYSREAGDMGLTRRISPPGVKEAYILTSIGFLTEATPGTQTRVIASPNETGGTFDLSHTRYTTRTADDSLLEIGTYPTAVFAVKGAIKLHNEGGCKIISEGGFIFVPAGRVYNYSTDEPGTELLVFSTCLKDGDSIPSRKYVPIPVGDTPATDAGETYLIKQEVGLCSVFGGFLTRPLLRLSNGLDQISVSIMESTTRYSERPFVDRWVFFTNVYHCFYILEGRFKFKIKGDSEWTYTDAGDSFFVPSRTFFIGDVASETARLILFANGGGVDEMVVKAGYSHQGPLPETIGKWDGWDEARVKSACAQLGAQIE